MPWLKGIPRKASTKWKIGKGVLKSKRFQDFVRRKTGVPLSPELKKKLSLASRNSLRVQRMHELQRGKLPSLKTRQKMSIAHSGSKTNFWMGGISQTVYSGAWTQTLKRSIRERDHYTCRVCGEEQGDIAHDVHHIDYTKINCSPENLITLCHRCHLKTNVNRGFWTKYFTVLWRLRCYEL